MEIQINGCQLVLKYCFRAHVAYETLTGEAFKWNGYRELGLFFYCCALVQCNDLKYEEFEAWLDENIWALEEFAKWLSGAMLVAHRMNTVADGEAESADPQKSEAPSDEKK